MMRQLISILLFTIFTQHALGCVLDSDVADIDWSKVKGTWYDAVDIPKNSGPLCWNFGKSRPIENGIRTGFYENEYWNEEDVLYTEIDFMHKSGGIYTQGPFNVTIFNEAVTASIVEWTRNEMGIPRLTLKEEDFTKKQKRFFLTDYEKYFIIVFCLDSGFRAYAKSPTRSISVEFLDDITEALNKVGLKSPTMTIKTGCLNNEGIRYTYGQTSPK